MATCRHCGEKIYMTEVRSFWGKSRDEWVHASSGKSDAHKCPQCGYVGTEETAGKSCPKCGSPIWIGAWFDHSAKP